MGFIFKIQKGLNINSRRWNLWKRDSGKTILKGLTANVHRTLITEDVHSHFIQLLRSCFHHLYAFHKILLWVLKFNSFRVILKL